MRRGEKGIFIVMAVIVGGLMIRNLVSVMSDKDKDRGIPFYSTLSQDEGKRALGLMRDNRCKECHSLWGGAASMMQSVPAPRLDGIGSIRDEAWFYRYLSAANPQSILPTRLKKEFSMPSYASMPDADRKEIAKYLASLKVKSWYLMQTKKSEFEKLTGNPYHP